MCICYFCAISTFQPADSPVTRLARLPWGYSSRRRSQQTAHIREVFLLLLTAVDAVKSLSPTDDTFTGEVCVAYRPELDLATKTAAKVQRRKRCRLGRSLASVLCVALLRVGQAIIAHEAQSVFDQRSMPRTTAKRLLMSKHTHTVNRQNRHTRSQRTCFTKHVCTQNSSADRRMRAPDNTGSVCLGHELSAGTAPALMASAGRAKVAWSNFPNAIHFQFGSAAVPTVGI